MKATASPDGPLQSTVADAQQSSSWWKDSPAAHCGWLRADRIEEPTVCEDEGARVRENSLTPLARDGGAAVGREEGDGESVDHNSLE